MLYSISPSSLLASILLAALPQGPAVQEQRFPPSGAIAEGVSPEALLKLSQLVQSFVDDEEIVGGELLMIANGKSILHEAYGWSNLDPKLPLHTGSLFCVRSMTKPLIGTAIGMLIKAHQLDYETHVAEYLPYFDTDGFREITVEQLLTHTSGLPMSHLVGLPLDSIPDIEAVAALGPEHPLAFEPGTAFEYSDQGADTLTALIAAVSGMSAEEYVTSHVLAPLGMSESTCMLTQDHPLRAQSIANYAGSRGAWTPFWTPDGAPLFPFFLGSQGLYSTCEDYARFLDFWSNRGRLGKQSLLTLRFVKKALTPGPHPMAGATGLPGLQAAYGYLMELWMATNEEGKQRLVALGHNGSDGTYAWAFPEQDAMVLFFTQSRGNTTGLRVEEALGELFLGAPFDPNQAAPPLEPYLGYYWEGEGDVYRAIIRDGDDLALEIPGRAIVSLSYMGEDRWKMRPNPSVVLAFDRAESGQITGYHIGDHQEFHFTPAASLPSAAELSARVFSAHRIDLLETLGPLRTIGQMTFERREGSGVLTTTLAWPGHWRYDNVFGDASEHLACDGETLWHQVLDKPAEPLAAMQAELLRDDNPFSRYNDWSQAYPSARTIQRLTGNDHEVFVVRTGDASAPARTIYIESATGYILSEASMTYIETLGRIGQRVSFSDFRDVSGMTLPFETQIEIEHPLIGTIHMTVDRFELGVELTEGTFSLQDLSH